MSSIIYFEDCLARPGSKLKNHLIDVKKTMESMFDDCDGQFKKLFGLAGLCHDLGKCHAEWQEYIRNQRNEGPNHSGCGAFIFSFLGYKLLQNMNKWNDYCLFWLWLIRDIADHHSRLKNLSDDNWLKKYSWEMFDLPGIETFVHEQYDELNFVKLDKESLEKWIDECDVAIEDAQDYIIISSKNWEPLEIMNKLQLWRKLTTSLIGGDRFDVTYLNNKWIDCKKHAEYLDNINRFCMNKKNNPLSEVRMKAQECIMLQLENDPNQQFYTLDMPTGYGKTIAALKISAWLGEKQGYTKIIYVAPYLSILEQTSLVIQEALKEKALEHHSLALLDIEDKQRAGENQLAMESWAHSIVCTSFNQFWKALFPTRAQDVLRRFFLKNSIVIIDEPQIFNPQVWNLFLCGLESLSSIYNLKAIFLSATMPPFNYGLSKEPKKLKINIPTNYNRYYLQIIKDLNEETLAEFLIKNDYDTQAAILNTIEDAYLVYKKVSAELPNSNNVYLLHGLMTPLHKKVIIEKVKLALKNKQLSEYPLYVISTQVLEAGVDVSFEHVARALSILPSIIQAAGRVNRHYEGIKKGIVSVFPFKRLGKKDTRSYIYPKNLQQITDNLLLKKEIWTETELSSLVIQYFKEMFTQNTYEGILASIKYAYLGDWDQISRYKPFGDDYLRLPVFISWEPDESDNELLINKLNTFYKLKQIFNVTSGNELYERYKDIKYMSKLSFEERKQFMILLHYYIINVPANKAIQIVGDGDYINNRIPRLDESIFYDSKTGLKIQFSDFDNFI